MRLIHQVSLALFALVLLGSTAEAQTPAGWEPAKNTPPANWPGPVFEPSFKFPTSIPAEDTQPWKAFDFKTEPNEYMEAVLDYVFEGQDPDSWRVQDNSVRKWYHVPWMVSHGNGREFIHGLTRERSTPAGDLGSNHRRCTQAWGVGFYNPIGGYTLGKVFGDGTSPPDVSEATFLPGTVVAKILFTEAIAQETDIVTGAPEWEVNINARQPVNARSCPRASNPRTRAKLRLFQLDVGVRDTDADEFTGWVFGTFIYDPASTQTNPWRKLRAVGLMWGNDNDLSDADAQNGQMPEESIILYKADLLRDFGRGGRMNGPVDNPVSSCLSCHSTAMFPQRAGMTPRRNDGWDRASCWFRNLNPTEPFGRPPSNTRACGQSTGGLRSLDYSLQLSRALINYSAAQPFLAELNAIPNKLDAPFIDVNRQLNDLTLDDEEPIYDVQR